MNHNPRQFMATQKRRYHPKKWAGVYVYETSEMYNGAPDLCFYITFKSGRRLIWEKVGKISEGYGPDVAAEIRAALSPAPETDADLIRINGQTSAGSSTRYLYKGDYLKISAANRRRKTSPLPKLRMHILTSRG
jgi:hypothetical protein